MRNQVFTGIKSQSVLTKIPLGTLTEKGWYIVLLLKISGKLWKLCQRL